MIPALKNIYTLYRDGFREMTLGKTLWKIILIKLFVMFVLLKIFFFPNYLQSHFTTDRERADHVLGQLLTSEAEMQKRTGGATDD